MVVFFYLLAPLWIFAGPVPATCSPFDYQRGPLGSTTVRFQGQQIAPDFYPNRAMTLAMLARDRLLLYFPSAETRNFIQAVLPLQQLALKKGIHYIFNHGPDSFSSKVYQTVAGPQYEKFASTSKLVVAMSCTSRFASDAALHSQVLGRQVIGLNQGFYFGVNKKFTVLRMVGDTPEVFTDPVVNPKGSVVVYENGKVVASVLRPEKIIPFDKYSFPGPGTEIPNPHAPKAHVPWTSKVLSVAPRVGRAFSGAMTLGAPPILFAVGAHRALESTQYESLISNETFDFFVDTGKRGRMLGIGKLNAAEKQLEGFIEEEYGNRYARPTLASLRNRMLDKRKTHCRTDRYSLLYRALGLLE